MAQKDFNGDVAQVGVSYNLYVSAGTSHVGEYALHNFKRYNLALAMLKAARNLGRTSFIIQGE